MQGHVVERRGHDIVRSIIRHLAVSHQPLMPLSFVAVEEMVKSRQALARALGTGDGAALDLLNLDVGPLIYGPCKGSRSCYRQDYTFRRGAHGALEHLVRCRGLSPKAATEVLLGLNKSLRDTTNSRKGGSLHGTQVRGRRSADR